MSISRLVIDKSYSEEKQGTCALCGPTLSPSFYPLEGVVSDNFVYYNKIRGAKICQRCLEFWKDDRFRRSSFIATPGEVRFVKPKEVVPFLLSPVYPFVVYLTKSYKKQGWIDGFRNISTDKSLFFIHTDFVGCVKTEEEEVKNLLTIVRKMTDSKIPKTHLLDMNMTTYRKILELGLEEEYKIIKEYKNSQILEVVIYVA